MPVRQEAAFIARSLGRVLGQTYPPDRIEVIVADGMSDGGTRQIVNSIANTHANLRLVRIQAGPVLPGVREGAPETISSPE